MHKRFERNGKFVEVRADDRVLTTIAGKIGTAGKTTTQKLRNARLCAVEAANLVAGYRKSKWTVVSAEPAPCAVTHAFPRDPHLEAALGDDASAFEVYADWLQAHGSPIGDLMAMQLANKGWKQALKDNAALRKGLNIVDGKVTYPAVAEAFALPYTPPDSYLN